MKRVQLFLCACLCFHFFSFQNLTNNINTSDDSHAIANDNLNEDSSNRKRSSSLTEQVCVI